LAALSALLLLVPDAVVGMRLVAPHGLVRGVIVAVAAVVLAWTVKPVPGLLVGYGRLAAVYRQYSPHFIFVGEGMNSSMAVSEFEDGTRNYHNAGKVQASSEPQDMRLQRMLGHITTLLPAHARNVLVIGCGAGVTAGAVS